MMKMQQSMSRKGDCWDISPTEMFFGSLKHEQLNYEKFKTKQAAKLSIIDVWLFKMVNVYTQNQVINPRWNLSGNSIRGLLKKVSGFS
jgi:transposase InsO family protein